MFRFGLAAAMVLLGLGSSANSQGDSPKDQLPAPKAAELGKKPNDSPTAKLPETAVARQDEFAPYFLGYREPIVTDGGAWVQAEYLPSWVRGASSPALVTYSPAGTSQAQAGVLSVPETQVLYGNERILNGIRSGFQVRFGQWIDPARIVAIEGGFIYRGSQNQNGVFGSNSGEIVSRPYTDALTGQAASQLVSYPNALNGSVSVNSSLPQFWGYDPLLRIRLCCSRNDDPCDPSHSDYRRWDLLVGYRHYEFSDEVNITENLFPTGANFVSGTQIIVQDQFRSRNRFDGLVLGIAGERLINRLYLQGSIRLNIGQTTRDVSIYGQTTVNVPGDVSTVRQGGLLALGSNIGTYRSTDWTVLPEAQLRIGYRVSNGLTAFIGYNVLIWPKTSRAVEQIDSTVNPNLIPPVTTTAGAARPAFMDSTSTFWLQGISFGLEWRF